MTFINVVIQAFFTRGKRWVLSSRSICTRLLIITFSQTRYFKPVILFHEYNRPNTASLAHNPNSTTTSLTSYSDLQPMAPNALVTTSKIWVKCSPYSAFTREERDLHDSRSPSPHPVPTTSSSCSTTTNTDTGGIRSPSLPITPPPSTSTELLPEQTLTTLQDFARQEPSHELSHHVNTGNHANNRRRRGNLPKPVTAILKTWLIEHCTNPYPTEDEKNWLKNETGLTLNQISNWFINARRRILPLILLKASASADQPAEHHRKRRGKPPSHRKDLSQKRQKLDDGNVKSLFASFHI